MKHSHFRMFPVSSRIRLGLLSVVGLLMSSAHSQSPDKIGVALSESIVSTSELPTHENGVCVAFRKSFQLAATPVEAKFHVFADARYMLWINGRYVDRGPGRFEAKAPEYDTLDVKSFLRAGRNTISILVTGQISNGKVQWRPLGLAARLIARTGKNATVVAQTDASWKWSRSIRYRTLRVDWANIDDVADARVEDGDWTQAEYDDAKWASATPLPRSLSWFHARTRVDDREINVRIDPFDHASSSGDRQSWWGPLTARRAPLLRETEVKPAWQDGVQWPVTLSAGQEVGLKFPHIVLAYADLELEAEAGSVVELTYSPSTRYVCKAGIQHFVTSDTHSIFEGAIRVSGGRVTLKHVRFVERLYPFSVAGSFKSSDPLLDKLWTTCVRGLEVTSEDAYVDCTDRERVEWMDCDPPAFYVTRVAMVGPSVGNKPAYGDPRLLEVMLRRTGYSLQGDGWVKAHTSSDRFDIHAKMEDRACDWVEGARRYYESSGKLQVVREIWPAIVRQMDYFLARRSSRGLVNAREWVVWGNPVGYQTCEGTALNAFVCRALNDAAFLGRKIGKTEDAGRFGQEAKQLAEAINSVLWDESSGTYFSGYYDLEEAKKAIDYRPLKLRVTNHLIEPDRHAALFALDQGIVPKSRRARVSKYLMAHAPTENDIMQYYYFFKQQYAADSPEQDLSVLQTLRKEWKDMAESPFEATFEGLHSWGSQAHCYGMFPAYFLSSYVLGVRLDGPVQNNRLIIEPRLADLSSASGTVVTEFGPVVVNWRRTESTGAFHVVVPEGAKTVLRMPFVPGSRPVLDRKPLVQSHRVGRWIEVAISPGSHSGSW